MEHTDEQTCVAQAQSILQPRFVRSLLTVELPALVEEVNERKIMVEQPKHNVPEVRFDELLSPSTFTYSKTNNKN